jgi:hypothetical protein
MRKGGHPLRTPQVLLNGPVDFGFRLDHSEIEGSVVHDKDKRLIDMSRPILRAAILLMATAVGATLQAQDNAHDDTLKGIKGVGVVVEDLRSDIEAAGLHEADVRTDVELKLRLAGIKVLTNGGALKQPGFPQLYINVNMMMGQGLASGIVAYHLSVALKQGVILARDSSINTWISTWQSDAVGYGGTGTLPKLRDNIKDMADKFINAYLSVNPPK